MGAARCLKEDFGMLDREAYSDMETIKAAAHKAWGRDCSFGEFKELNSPYPEFEWFMMLYDRFNIKLVYDRSILYMEVPTKDGYRELSRITEENVFWGFEGMAPPENLLHNFRVLDRIVREM